jgi:hypothetical protein
MSSKTNNRIATAAAWLAILGLVVYFAFELISGSTLRQLTNGRLDDADYWSDKPSILSAGMGFDNIIGLPEISEASVSEAGGSWYGGAACTNGEKPSDANRTSAAATGNLDQAYEGSGIDHDDGLPVVFSWPVATETVDPTDFKFTLNTGEIVYGHAAGMNPNWENNERNTVVLFGDFGNRQKSTEPGAAFPVKLEILPDDTPLTLVGPGGREVSAVGLTWTTDRSPYDAGPSLVGAKLNRVGAEPVGEGGVTLIAASGTLPNDELALYGTADFRIRVLTTGGFSPDGVTALRPDMFEDFFRLHATGPDGQPIILDQIGTNYQLQGGNLQIIGLSDLGQAEKPDDGIYYDDCYQEDRDNYIDIILSGDEAAARSISFVEIPSIEGNYKAFYNPGGPGPEPYAGIRYTAPGPPDLEPVLMALDNPMRVSRNATTGVSWPLVGLVVVLSAAAALGIIGYRKRHSKRHEPAGH